MQRAQHTRRRPRLILIILLILVIVFGLHHFLSLGARLKANWNKIVYTSSDNVSIAVYSPRRIISTPQQTHPSISFTPPVPLRLVFWPAC